MDRVDPDTEAVEWVDRTDPVVLPASEGCAVVGVLLKGVDCIKDGAGDEDEVAKQDEVTVMTDARGVPDEDHVPQSVAVEDVHDAPWVLIDELFDAMVLSLCCGELGCECVDSCCSGIDSGSEPRG